MNIGTTRLFAVVLFAGTVLIGLLGLSVFAGSLARRPSEVYVGGGMTPTKSPHRTIAPEGETVGVDFQQCTEDLMRISVKFGSTTLKIVGRDGNVCRLDYGGEVENPNWDGKLDHSCRVPTRLGLVQFVKRDTMLDLAPIERYCIGPTPRGTASDDRLSSLS